jgi:hypothetical protein
MVWPKDLLPDLERFLKERLGFGVLAHPFVQFRQVRETISTAFVESTINQVVSRRFVKKQQMQWTLRGAHLLLQTRTKVLNEDLDDLFRRWYPKFRPQPQTQEPERKAA